MKKNLSSMLLLMGASIILFTGCRKNEMNDLSPVNTNSAAGGAKSLGTPAPVTISVSFPYDNSQPTFIAAGGLSLSGNASMNYEYGGHAYALHCTVVLSPSTGGTITIHQQCEFANVHAPFYRGRWEVVSGTGAYANLKSNGSLTMPYDDFLEISWENMTGFIY